MSITLAIVIPVYSAEKYLEDLAQSIINIGNEYINKGFPVNLDHIVFVDDDSIDNSHELLRKLSYQYDKISVVTLSRNFGQHSATVAGILHTSSDWVVTMDEDLQHRPEHIERLFKHAIFNQLDVVYANPKGGRVHNAVIRDKTSKLFKLALGQLSNNKKIRQFNSFRLIRGEVARAAAASSTSFTYFDIAISWYTNRVDSQVFEMEDPRYTHTKTSGYTFSKLLAHARRLFVSSHVDVTKWGTIFGVIVAGLASAVGLLSIINKFFFPESIAVPGWASIFALAALLGAFGILLLCVLIEYVSVILTNQLGKPNYFVIDREKDKVLIDYYKNERSIN